MNYNPEPDEPPAVEQFYEALEGDLSRDMRQAAETVRGLVRRTMEDVVEIGRTLRYVKDKLEHGQFFKWLELEFAWSTSTAQRFMAASEMIERLEKDSYDFGPSHYTILPTALYTLAGGPEEAQKEAFGRAAAGEEITPSKAREIVSRHKEPEYTEHTEKHSKCVTMTNLDDQVEIIPPRPPREPEFRAFGDGKRPAKPLASISLAHNILKGMITRGYPGELGEAVAALKAGWPNETVLGNEPPLREYRVGAEVAKRARGWELARLEKLLEEEKATPAQSDSAIRDYLDGLDKPQLIAECLRMVQLQNNLQERYILLERENSRLTERLAEIG